MPQAKLFNQQPGKLIQLGGPSDSASLSPKARNLLGGEKPFFSGFLEDQSRVSGATTLRYPSDSDGGKPGFELGGSMTLRFPSDSDSSGIGGIGRPEFDIGGSMTMKFPSDSDSGGIGGIGGPGFDVAGSMTLKFPSDGDSGFNLKFG